MRFDAGMGIGLGHLVRSLAVAVELVDRGCAVTVATRTVAPEFVARITDSGAAILPLSANSAKATLGREVWEPGVQLEDAKQVVSHAPPGGWDAVVVDHYCLSRPWEASLRDHARRVIAIDDLANRPHAAAVLVDQNWYGEQSARRYADLVDPGTIMLLGPRYALLQRAYRQNRTRRGPVRRPPQRVLVNFGGTDAAGQTALALQALKHFPALDVTAVLGTEAAVTPQVLELIEESGARLQVALPHLADVLSSTDLAIGASGTATWERICLDVPALVTTVSAAHSGVTSAFSEAGMLTWLGTAEQVGEAEYREALSEVIAEGGKQPLEIVDGFGAARVALAAVLPPAGTLTTRRAARHEAPSVVATSLQDGEGPATWKHRATWFYEQVGSEEGITLIMCDSLPTGVAAAPDGTTPGSLDPYLHIEELP